MAWVFFPLHPDTPPEGRTLESLFAGHGIDLDAAHERMQQLMDAEQLPYARRTHTYNSRLAQELGKWADTQPDGDPLHNALYRAYFAASRNIDDIGELVAQAEAADLPADAARQVLVERRFKEAVDADWARASRLGITGVPTFVIGEQSVVGAQPYDALREFAIRQGATPRLESP